MTRRISLSVVAALLVGGCANVYFLDGQKYDSKEKFFAAIDAHSAAALDAVTPHQKPLSTKTLTCAVPSDQVFLKLRIQAFAKAAGREPSGPQLESQENLAKSDHLNTRVFCDATQKKNIYALVRVILMEDGAQTFAASADTDAIFLSAPAPTAAQWYYVSAKGGKQVFAYDRSSPNATGKVLAFVDAVQALAIRD